MEKSTLVYGMRLIAGEEIAAVEHAQVLMESGQTRQVTMHTLEGTREQIKRQLLESIDAFFEIHDQ
ncbi:MAG TPA: allantoinase [Blastocatellia bacterium]|nr:allantoinase [Blastocatellia bacterium]